MRQGDKGEGSRSGGPLRRAGGELRGRWPAGRVTVERPSLRQAFSALDAPLFRNWFLSQILSASGTITQGVALSWLVLKLTGSAVDLGLMSSCTFLPMIVFGPWSGVLVDRVSRRRLLIVTQSLFITLALVLATVTATGVVRVWMLFPLAFATGLVTAPDSTARQVYVTELVPREQLPSAVSLYEVILNASRVLGPATGGVLLATAGVDWCCFLNAASYVAPLAVLLSGRAARAPRRPAGDGGSRTGQFRAGLRYAWQSRPIRICMAMAAASGMLFNLTVALPLMATRVFHVDGGGYGLMMSMFGVGAIGGALLAASSAKQPTWRSVRVLATVTALAILATAVASSLGLALAGLAVTGWLSIWFIARANTVVQLATAPEMRGRVMGLWTMALPGSLLVTGPCVGVVAATLGARAGFGLAGAALLACAALGWRALSGGSEPQPSAAASEPWAADVRAI